jgi:GNAT superfamily N-acetyltransferase
VVEKDAPTSRVGLREALPADSDFVFGVRCEAFREYVERAGGWDDRQELDAHVERFARQRFRLIVADDVEVGYVATAVYPDATSQYPPGLYVHQLMVLPAFQSKGIGGACLALLAEEARVLGVSLRLRVLRVNPRALAFYLGSGMKVADESAMHVTLELP